MREGIPLIRSQNVHMGRFDPDGLVHITPAQDAEMIGSRVHAGDVLLNITGASIGRVCVAPSHLVPANVSQHVCIIRSDGRWLPEFLCRFLSTPEFQRFIWSDQAGATRQALTKAQIEEFLIPLPPLAEQERIAGWVSRGMEQAAAARRAALDRLAAAEALPAALLREVFEGPQARGWETRTIDDFAKTCSGATPSRGNAAYFGGGVPWVKTGELRDGFVGDDGSTEESVTEAALRDCSLPLLPPGTLLIAMYGQGKTRGRTGILTREATTNQACFAILPDPDVFDTGFLQLWFRANYHDLRALTENRGGNQPNLNGVLLRELEVPLPDPATQRRLAAELTEKLDAAEGVIARCREELAAIESLPAALLRQAFGGPPAPGD